MLPCTPGGCPQLELPVFLGQLEGILLIKGYTCQSGSRELECFPVIAPRRRMLVRDANAVIVEQHSSELRIPPGTKEQTTETTAPNNKCSMK
jgi:hypothetical protein